jgi:prefoldin subunit 5
MTGFRMTASHDIINRQYEQLGQHYERLGKLIGERQAVEVLIATLELAGDQRRSI